MHIKLRTLRNGPSIRNRVRLPHPVRTDVRVCVICPPDSRHAADARRAGAVLVGEDEVFAAVLAKRIEFDRCLCHPDSLARLNKSGVARILGPRRLMPTPKTGTVVSDIGRTVAEMVSGSEYRERLGVVRMAVGHLGLTPEELQSNIRAFMAQVKKDASVLSEKIKKEIHEVVRCRVLNAPHFFCLFGSVGS
jgi:large subunit ribosomal protein L1